MGVFHFFSFLRGFRGVGRVLHAPWNPPSAHFYYVGRAGVAGGFLRFHRAERAVLRGGPQGLKISMKSKFLGPRAYVGVQFRVDGSTHCLTFPYGKVRPCMDVGGLCSLIDML